MFSNLHKRVWDRKVVVVAEIFHSHLDMLSLRMGSQPIRSQEPIKGKERATLLDVFEESMDISVNSSRGIKDIIIPTFGDYAATIIRE